MVRILFKFKFPKNNDVCAVKRERDVSSALWFGKWMRERSFMHWHGGYLMILTVQFNYCLKHLLEGQLIASSGT